MTKHRVASELEDISEELLRDLDPDERVRMILRARTRDDDRHVKQLVDSTPRKTYKSVDHEYRNRMLFATTEAMSAAYAIQTAYLEFMWMSSETTHWNLQDLFDLIPESLRDPPEDIDMPPIDERRATYEFRKQRALTNLYITYHTYRRFAEEQLGLSLEEFIIPTQPEFDPAPIEDCLGIYEGLIEEIENEAKELTDDDESLPTHDEIVENELEVLVDEWENADDPNK